jgi:DNA-binding transcriptional LysR family regulator
MNIRDLEAFLAVIEAGSIMAASARLHLTQPGVSRRVQVLEETLGVTLLDRQSKPLKPTAEGLRTYEHGRRILGVMEDLKAGFSPDGEIGGEFRVGITPYLSEVALSAPLDRLRSEFPNLTLNVSVGWPEQLLEKMRRSEIDTAAFCSPEGVEPTEGYEGYAVGVQSLVVVAPKKAKLSSSVTLRDLSHFHWILNQDGCGIRSVIRRRFEQERLALRIGIEALSSDLRMSLVARGLGLTLSTKRAFAESPFRAELRTVKVEDLHPRVGAWIIHRPALGRLTRPVDCFKDEFVAAFAR